MSFKTPSVSLKNCKEYISINTFQQQLPPPPPPPPTKAQVDHGREEAQEAAGRLTSVVGGRHGRVHEPLRGQAGRCHRHDRGGEGLRSLRTAYPLGVL